MTGTLPGPDPLPDPLPPDPITPIGPPFPAPAPTPTPIPTDPDRPAAGTAVAVADGVPVGDVGHKLEVDGAERPSTAHAAQSS